MDTQEHVRSLWRLWFKGFNEPLYSLNKVVEGRAKNLDLQRL